MPSVATARRRKNPLPKPFETLSSKIFSLQRSFLFLRCSRKVFLLHPNANESQNPWPFCKIQPTPLAKTKSLAPARTIPLVEKLFRWYVTLYDTLSATLFLLQATERIMLQTCRDFVSSVAMFACSSGAFPSGRVMHTVAA